MTHPAQHFLLESEAIQLISSYGIAYPQYRFASSADEAVMGADAIGYPVVVKVVSSGVIHKSDVGGVAMHLNDADAVREAFRGMQAVVAKCPGTDMPGVLVCEQAPEGVDVIVGGFRDETFGPTIMFGLGGIFAEVMDDVAFRVAPIDHCEAAKLIREIRSWPLLDGARGRPACDIEGLISLVVAVSQLMTEHAEIESIDLNPVRVFSDSVRALDARIEIKGASATT